MKPNQRGSSLILAMIVLAVLTILAASAVTFTGQEASSAAQFQKRESLAACSVAARNWMMSFFEAGVANSVDVLKVARSIDTGRFLIHTGHIGQGAGDAGFPPGIEASGGGLATTAFVDQTNTTIGGGGGLGTRTYRAVATCIEKETGAASEVEFEIRLAL